MAFLFRSVLTQSLSKATRPMWATMGRTMSSHNKETDAEFDARWKAYFERPEIDGSFKQINDAFLNETNLFIFQVGIFVKVSII